MNSGITPQEQGPLPDGQEALHDRSGFLARFGRGILGIAQELDQGRRVEFKGLGAYLKDQAGSLKGGRGLAKIAVLSSSLVMGGFYVHGLTDSEADNNIGAVPHVYTAENQVILNEDSLLGL